MRAPVIARFLRMRRLLRLVGGLLYAGTAAAAPRPNVLFLVVDDLTTALGCYGDPLARTPALDALAAQGCLFEGAYCQQALCAPSRASVLTGRRPETFPATMAGSQTAHYRDVLPDVVTLPQAFRLAGYHTESIGKVNHVYPPLLDPPSWSAPERLADIPKRDEYLRPENRVGGFIDPMVKGTATESVAAPDDAYQDGQAATAAIEALHRLRDRPFFLAVGFKRPHLPWACPESYWQRHERARFALGAGAEADVAGENEVARFPWRFEWRPATGELRGYADIPARGPLPPGRDRELRHGYYACVSYVDAQVGRIVGALRDLGLAERTIVVLWADNGFHLGEAGQWGKKRNTERATRVPLLVVAPGVTAHGSRTEALVELVDLYPTLLELAGLPAQAGLEGTSFVPVLARPERAWKEAVFSVYQQGDVIGRSVRTAGLRYTEWRREGTLVDCELYRAGVTEREANNLAALPDWQASRQALSARLADGWRAVQPP